MKKNEFSWNEATGVSMSRFYNVFNYASVTTVTIQAPWLKSFQRAGEKKSHNTENWWHEIN